MGKQYKFLFYVEQNYSFDILRPLQAAALSVGYQVKWLLVGDDITESFLNKNEDRVANLEKAVEFCADAVFAPGDRIPSFIPGMKVQVFHGLTENKRGGEYPERGLFDLYCTEGPLRTKTLLKTAEKKPYLNVVETGWLKLDRLFDNLEEKKHPVPQILFTSTFSTSLSCAEQLFEEIEKLSSNNKWQWLITLHPKMLASTVQKYKGLKSSNVLFFENNEVIEAMHRADLLVGDNSSILEEFLLLKKPVVTVNNRAPISCFNNISQASDLEHAIEQSLKPSQQLMDEMNKFGATITPLLDGQSATRVVAAVTQLLERPWKNKKPLNLLRNFKMRKKLHYWKW